MQGFDRIESSSTVVGDAVTALSARDKRNFLLLLLLLPSLPFTLISALVLRCAPKSSSTFLFLLAFLSLLFSGFRL
jgi:hypothetical protein